MAYAGIWLYVVVLLSRLSLPLVAATVGVIVAVAIAGRRAASQLGASEATVQTVSKVSEVALGVVAMVVTL